MSSEKWSTIWLLTGSFLMYFSNWNWAVPVAAWLFPVFLLRFTHTRNTGKGLLLLGIACLIVGVASMWRLLALEVIPPSFRVVSGLAVGVIFFLPFVVDRLLAIKLPGFAATLIFPFTWTALEYLKSLGNGSWGALAYTQYGNLPLMQLASVTGIWGVSFLITWFAAIINFAWEQQFTWHKIKRIAVVYGLIITSALLFGYNRIALNGESEGKVCIASVSNPRDFVVRFYKPDWTDRQAAYKYMQEDLDYLFNATVDLAHAGAGIVFWQEYSVSVIEEKEQEFLDRAKEVALEQNIYLGLAIALFPSDYPDRPWQNKLVWIGPEGKVIDEYLKLKPAPPLEPIAPGKGGISIIDTTYGKIASAICADLDYPNLIHQAGTDNAGLLLIPAQGWATEEPLHAHMAVFRAIENGLSLVMGNGGGLSIAVDPYGRTINTQDYFNSHEKKMISCLSTKGVATIYSKIGDTFAWLCTFGVIVITLWGVIRGRNKL